MVLLVSVKPVLFKFRNLPYQTGTGVLGSPSNGLQQGLDTIFFSGILPCFAIGILFLLFMRLASSDRGAA